MGTFRIDFELENPAQPGRRALVKDALVDTGSELSWVNAAILESLGVERWKLSRFRQANGTILERWTGSARLYAAGTGTVDEIVFGEPGDLVLLGSRSLEASTFAWIRSPRHWLMQDRRRLPWLEAAPGSARRIREVCRVDAGEIEKFACSFDVNADNRSAVIQVEDNPRPYLFRIGARPTGKLDVE